MVWRSTALNHIASIGNFARRWLSWSMVDRLIPVTILGWGWCLAVGFLGISSGDWHVLVFCLLILAPLPWLLWLLDGWLDTLTVNSDLDVLIANGAILATRCQYLGGHPELPHARFAYLLLDGTRQDPSVSVAFPTSRDEENTLFEFNCVPLPLLDVGNVKLDKGADDSPAADVASAINKNAGGFLRSEKLTLVVDYDGPGGRKHKVEFANFFGGNSEVRKWQNFITCAQAQADTDIEPVEPWIALPSGPPPKSDLMQTTKEMEQPHAVSGNGHKERKASSAFSRR